MSYRSPFPEIDIPAVSLADYVFEHAAGYPDKCAIIDAVTGRTLTYGGLSVDSYGVWPRA